VDIDETEYELPGVDPTVSVLSVATAKALAVPTGKNEVVLAADTQVIADGTTLGKPRDAADAEEMLLRLGGRPHEVLTAVALKAEDARRWCGVVSTRVFMRDYSREETLRYVARGEPFDKAGGYAIQDAQFAPVERVLGCYLNVVGLPLCAVAAGLRALGSAEQTVEAAGPPPCSYCRAGTPLVAVSAG
jgi:MAF protein